MTPPTIKPPKWLALTFIGALLLGYLWIEFGHHIVPGASAPEHGHTEADAHD